MLVAGSCLRALAKLYGKHMVYSDGRNGILKHVSL